MIPLRNRRVGELRGPFDYGRRGGKQSAHGVSRVRGVTGAVTVTEQTKIYGGDPMNSADVSSESMTKMPTPGVVEMNLEVIVIAVGDVDRAKRFYANLGWRLDADLEVVRTSA